MSDHDLQARRAFLEARAARSRIAGTYGYTVCYDDDGEAVLTMAYNPALDNGVGGTHGGVIATLIDIAAWYAVAPAYERWIATAELQTRFLEPGAAAGLRVVARPVRSGRRIASAEAEAYDDDGRLLATGQATFTLTGKELKLDP